MTSALTFTIHLKPVTVWLFIAIPCLVLGGFLSALAWSLRGGEMGALMPLTVGVVLAGIALILAIGSML